MKKLIIHILLFNSLFVFAQEASIGGLIVDTQAEPISFVTVLLFENGAAEPFTGVTTDANGIFLLKNLEEKDYRINFSFIGYTSKRQTVAVVGAMDLGKITLTEAAQSLDEALVVAKKPTINRTLDRLIFNVEKTTLSTGTSWEILKKTPGVITIQDNLLIRGQGATVYLNDRKVQISASELKTFLEGFSGANVQSVEVIMNPSAEYDAESGPILNIKTSKNASLGYKGSIEGDYTQAIFPKYRLGTSHFYKNKKLNLFLNYGFNPKKEFKEDEAEINFIDSEDNVFSRWKNDFNRTTRSKAHSANFILDYDFDEKNSVNLTTSLLHSPNRTFDNNIINEAFSHQQQLDSTFVSKSHLKNDLNNAAFDLSYKHKFNREGTQLSANFHYTDYERDRDQSVSTNYFDPNDVLLRNFSFFTDASQDIEIYTSRLDLETPLLGTRFGTGVKASIIDSKSGIDFFDIVNSNSTFNSVRSDNFLYDENVFAAYANATKVWKSWSLKLGARVEQTEVKGKSLSVNETIEQNYFELFPSFYAQHIFNENHSIAFDYSRGINRPHYEELNPFAYFLNENNFQLGNPELQPSFSNEFNLNYTLSNKYFFDVYYRDRGNFISTLSFQDNINQTVRTLRQNIVEAVSYGLDFVHSRSITDFWYFYTYLSLFYETETFIAVESKNVEVTNDITGFFGQAYNSFTLSKDGSWTGDLTVVYWSGFIFGSFQQESNTNLSVGLRKKLWRNRATLTLRSEDILGTANSRLSSKYLNQDYSYLAVPETQFIRFGFTYNFGNYKLNDNERDIHKRERDRLEEN